MYLYYSIYACKQHDILRQCTYRACRTPNCPSKCTYRSLSADPPMNKHWDIQLVWYTHAIILFFSLRFLYVSCLTGKILHFRERKREIEKEKYIVTCRIYSNRNCLNNTTCFQCDWKQYKIIGNLFFEKINSLYKNNLPPIKLLRDYYTRVIHYYYYKI